MYKFVFLLLLFLIPNKEGITQSTNFEAISIDQGLSQGMVYDMLQDKEGFIWFATKDGLNRYDGYSFTNFLHDSKKTNSISSNVCTALLEDSKGRIWVGTERDGLNLYDAKTQQFSRAKIADKYLNDAGNYQINSLKEDKEGNIWVMIENSSRIFKVSNTANIQIGKDFSDFVSVKDENSKPIKFDSFCFSNKPFNKEEFSVFFPQILNLFKNWIPNIYNNLFLQDKNNFFWISDYYGVLFNKNGVKRKIPSSEIIIEEAMFNLSDGTIVLGSFQHIWIFTPEELASVDSLTAKNAYCEAPKEILYCSRILKDKANNLWFGTRGYGAVKYKTITRKFHSYLQGFSLGEIKVGNKNEILINANYRPSINFYDFDLANNQYRVDRPFNSHRLMHHSLGIDKENHYWVLGQFSKENQLKLYHYSADRKLLNKYNLPDKIAVEYFYNHLQIGPNHTIWIGGSDGLLYCFDTKLEKFTTYNYKKLLPKFGAIKICNYIYFDVRNNVWLCTESGLLKLSNYSTNPIFKIFKSDKNTQIGIGNNNVSSCLADPRNPDILWVSTKGGGLEKLNVITGEFTHFNKAQGLPNNVIYGLLLGSDSNIWMSSNRGISKYNIRNNTFSNYNKLDGLQDNEFNSNSFGYGNNGDLYFGGVNGLTIFNPNDFITQNVKPIIKIIELVINNKTIIPLGKDGILQQDIQFQKSIELAFNQNQIRIDMSVMDFTNPLKNRFKYKLKGIDDEWVDAGNQHFANYAQLPSGNYIFMIQGTTDGEIWSDVVELVIVINPSWYKSWWAYLLYIISVIAVAYYWYNNQLSRVRLKEQIIYKEKEAKQLAVLDVIKTNFFSNISHEIRTPLTLILAPSQELMQRNPKEILYSLINRNANRLLELINQLLDISKLEAGQMKIYNEPCELVNFLNLKFSDFQSIADAKQINYQFAQNKTVYQANIDKDKWNKIINNVLSNAIKFTNNNGVVKANVMYDDNANTCTIEISDNGIGIEQQKLGTIFNRFYQNSYSNKKRQEGTGIGLALVKELVELLKGSITVTSIPNQKTCFTIVLPITFLS